MRNAVQTKSWDETGPHFMMSSVVTYIDHLEQRMYWLFEIGYMMSSGGLCGVWMMRTNYLHCTHRFHLVELAVGTRMLSHDELNEQNGEGRREDEEGDGRMKRRDDSSFAFLSLFCVRTHIASGSYSHPSRISRIPGARCAPYSQRLPLSYILLTSLVAWYIYLNLETCSNWITLKTVPVFKIWRTASGHVCCDTHDHRTKLDPNNRSVMMAPTLVLPFHVPFLLSALCYPSPRSLLIRIQRPWEFLRIKVNLNHNVGKYNGRKWVRCKNDNYHYTMHG